MQESEQHLEHQIIILCYIIIIKELQIMEKQESKNYLEL